MGLLGKIAGGVAGLPLGGPGVVGGAILGNNLEDSATGMPTLQSPGLDPGTNALIAERNQRAMQDPNARAAEQLAGTDQTQGLAQAQQTTAAKNQALGGDQGAMSDAINRRAQKGYGSSLNRLQTQVHRQVPLEMANELAGASGTDMQQAQIEQQRMNFQLDAEMQQEAARNQVISSLLGVVGQGGGMAIRGAGNGTKGGTPSPGEPMSNSQSGGMPGSGGAGPKVREREDF